MLTSVEIHSYFGDNYFGVQDPPIVFPLYLADAEHQYFVKDIDGLGPTKAEIVMTTYAGMPGGAYQTANVASRNIVAQIGFNPDFTVDDPFGELRRDLYSRMNPEMRVDLHFISDNMETVKIAAYIESFEPSIFSADPMMTFSFICPDPYFYSLEELKVGRSDSGLITVDNPGNARQTGFTAYFDRISTPGINHLIVDGIVYPHPRYKDNKSDIFSGTYISGEMMIFRLVTVPGQKSASWMTSDSYHNYVEMGIEAGGEAWEEYSVDILGYNTGWAYLVPGLNTFGIQMPVSGIEPTKFWMTFVPRYVGL